MHRLDLRTDVRPARGRSDQHRPHADAETTADAQACTAKVAVLRPDAPHQHSDDCSADQRHQNDVAYDQFLAPPPGSPRDAPGLLLVPTSDGPLCATTQARAA